MITPVHHPNFDCPTPGVQSSFHIAGYHRGLLGDVADTLRGRPFALISPVTSESLEETPVRPPEEAWKDIEDTLRKAKPKFRNVNETMNWTRKR